MASKKHKAKTAWLDSDKRRAVSVYKSVGSMVKTTEITGIPDQTLRFWMKQDWWNEWLRQIKAEDTAILEDAATDIAKLGGDVVRERLKNGDFILNKEGELIRKPVSARDAAIITAVSIDKRKLLQEEPIREQQLNSAERLLSLVEQFTRFASAREIKGVVREVAKIEQTKVKDAEFTELQEELQAGSSDGDEPETGVSQDAESGSPGYDSGGESRAQ
jgi:hypothetical protein